MHKEHRHGCLASVFSSVLMRFFGLWISANIHCTIKKLTPGLSFALFLISSFIFSLVLVDSHCVAQGQGDQAGGEFCLMTHARALEGGGGFCAFGDRMLSGPRAARAKKKRNSFRRLLYGRRSARWLALTTRLLDRP